MFLCLKKFFVFILITIFRRKWRKQTILSIVRNCKNRLHRSHVSDVPEEVDELSAFPDGTIRDQWIVGFNKYGSVVSFRLFTTAKKQRTATVMLDIAGVGRFKHSQRNPKPGSGSLQLLILEPMKRWKVQFRKRMISNGIEQDMRDVTVSLYWQCLSDPFDHFESVSSWQLAKHLIGFNLFDLHSTLQSLLLKDGVFYEQWGQLWGRIEVDGYGSFDHRFTSFRSQVIGKHYPRDFKSHHVNTEKEGFRLVFGSHGEDFQTRKQYGYVTYPCGESWASCVTEQTLEDELQIGPVCNSSAGGINYSVVKTEGRMIMKHEHLGETYAMAFSRFNVNGKNAFGVTISKTGFVRSWSFDNQNQVGKANVDSKVLAIEFNGEDELSLSHVGGKAKQLNFLKRQGYRVPDGICITTHALDIHVNQNTGLSDAIDAITKCIQQKQFESLQPVCKNAVDSCISSTIQKDVQEAIVLALGEQFGPHFEKCFFAVRSSGLDEDNSETSFAGQLKSILNVNGTADILRAILECWASSFAYQAVEYRRQNGQPVIRPMGVIIQRMVAAQLAGVLFTCDPLSRKSSILTVNASKGLGEAVVSGICTPDTITIQRGHASELLILSRIRGSDSTNLEQEAGNLSGSNTIILTDEQILSICKTGIQIEHAFECPVDIEWAIFDDELFILQARPITSLDMDIDKQLVHEFDCPLAGEEDCITSCIMGELLPGVATPLSVDIYMRACNNSINNAVQGSTYIRLPKHAICSAMSFSNQLFLNMTTICLPSNRVPLFNKDNIELFLMGQRVSENKASVIAAAEGRGKPFFTTVCGFIRHFIIRKRQQPRLFAKWAEEVDHFSVGENATDAASLYACIDESIECYFTVWKTHAYKSSESSQWTGALMGILRGHRERLTPENHADIALLLSNCENVESANVPFALEDLARTISASEYKEEFLSVRDEDGHTFLMECSDVALQQKYSNFISRHGHRCIREVELLEKSWGIDPSTLIRTLKTMINSGLVVSENKPVPSLDEAFGSLKTSLPRFQKLLLKKFIVPKARKGVGAREFGKSITIKTGDVIKQAYWRLADMMVREGRLPEDRLLFYLTHREIGTLLDTRSPALIRIAKRRLRIVPLQESIRYPKINVGRPKPIPEETSSDSKDDVIATGFAVGRGSAYGRACVVKALNDADCIEKGDILICPVTDVGWSPYFSIISGLVTEMGGLLSHGAVVAREVGLPCIVNVPDATRIFRTGDQVKIDGEDGSIQRIKE